MEYELNPAQFGLATASLDSIRVNGAAESLAIIRTVLDNTPGPARDIVLLNAGAALYVAGVAESVADGVEQAAKVLASGDAAAKLAELVVLTQSLHLETGT